MQGVLLEVCLLLAIAVSVDGQGVACWSLLTCTGNLKLADLTDCCNNQVEPQGAAFMRSGVEGCFRCPRSIGFNQTTLIGREREEEYVVEAGFLTGQFDTELTLDIILILDTAGPNDIALTTTQLKIPPNRGILLPVKFTLSADSVSQESDETFSLKLVTDTSLFPPVNNVDFRDSLEVTILDINEITFSLSQDIYTATEKPNGAITVQVIKDPNILLGNPVLFRIHPLTIKQALNYSIIDNFEAENPLSPNRATVEDFNGTVLDVTFPADESSSSPISNIPANIFIADDDINEAERQYFIVHLEVIGAINFDLLSNEQRNTSTCVIIDDDPLQIGFEFPFYNFSEPNNTETNSTSSESAFLLKEGNRTTEQTFSVLITVGNPGNGLLPASLKSTNSNVDYDYSLGQGGQDSINLLFLPSLQRIEFTIYLNGDDMAEGFESFRANTTSSDGFPVFQAPANLSSSALIHIQDNDEATVGFFNETYLVNEGDMRFFLAFGVISGKLEREVSLQLTLQDGSAKVGSDYISTSSGGSFLVFYISLIILVDDSSFELSETFSARLSFPTEPLPAIRLDPTVTNITILDNDILDFGFNQTSYSVGESSGRAALFVFLRGDLGVFTVAATTTTDENSTVANATANDDYVPTSSILNFTRGISLRTFYVGIVNDTINESPEIFEAILTSFTLIGANGKSLSPTPQERSRIRFSPDRTRVVVIDDDDIKTNDTINGDPYFSVPLNIPKEQLKALRPRIEKLSLCYEVHGENRRWFNLVTDECVTVNSRFRAFSRGHNIIDDVCVKAVDDENHCVKICVSIYYCAATVNGVHLRYMERYSSGGVSVRRYTNRVRISVPNCADLTFIMWVICQREHDLGNYPAGDMIKLVITRGLNFGHRHAHGLLGQFWNIPVTISPYTGPLRSGSRILDRYVINITSGHHPRSFTGYMHHFDWDFDETHCLYVGDTQAGPIYEVEKPNDPVIEGDYRDYEVENGFSERDYKFGLFNEARCRASPNT